MHSMPSSLLASVAGVYPHDFWGWVGGEYSVHNMPSSLLASGAGVYPHALSPCFQEAGGGGGGGGGYIMHGMP